MIRNFGTLPWSTKILYALAGCAILWVISVVGCGVETYLFADRGRPIAGGERYVHGDFVDADTHEKTLLVAALLAGFMCPSVILILPAIALTFMYFAARATERDRGTMPPAPPAPPVAPPISQPPPPMQWPQ